MRKGFTLVELLVVVAILGILTSIVIASTVTSRAKANDTRRIADMKEIQLGLALYYDVNKSYPANLTVLATQKYLPAIPTDPAGGSYEYVPTGTPATHYCIGVRLQGSVPSDNASCALGAGSTANYKAYR